MAEDPGETLTVHRLGLPHLLRKTFRLTNPIESLFDEVVCHPRRVESWKRGCQVARWWASGLLLHEQRFGRIKGHKQMHLLLRALENQRVGSKREVA